MIDELKLDSEEVKAMERCDANRFRRNVPVREMDGIWLVEGNPGNGKTYVERSFLGATNDANVTVPEPVHRVDPRSELDMFMFISLLAQEVERADKKHGNWRDADLNFMTDKIRSEVSEVLDAVDRGDLNGEHGMKTELIHVTCTVYKMWRAL